METRAPAVAGRFYPADPELLEREIQAHLQRPPGVQAPRPALAVMVPHAGYVYSGAIAGQTFAAVLPAKRALVMAPNHTGRGARRALYPGASFLLPGGALQVDRELNLALREVAEVSEDEAAHRLEHAVEVELPFLRARHADVRVSALCLSGLSLRECAKLGAEVASAVSRAPGTLLVASSDMSHYIPAGEARRLDDLALQRILALDPEGLYETVTRHDISMCGFIPTTVMLFAARAAGAKRAQLVRYGNSAERSGDETSVVGYAGVIVD
jgi:MEMO1 family protein